MDVIFIKQEKKEYKNMQMQYIIMKQIVLQI
jgi:hypothetical protein